MHFRKKLRKKCKSLSAALGRRSGCVFGIFPESRVCGDILEKKSRYNRRSELGDQLGRSLKFFENGGQIHSFHSKSQLNQVLGLIDFYYGNYEFVPHFRKTSNFVLIDLRAQTSDCTGIFFQGYLHTLYFQEKFQKHTQNVSRALQIVICIFFLIFSGNANPASWRA